MCQPPDNDEGRPGKGGPVTIPTKVIDANTTHPVSPSAAVGNAMNSMLAHAMNSIERGAPVFPVRAPLNAPAIPSAHPKGDPLRGKCRGECGRDGHGFHDATTDADTIRRWWTAYPDANIGIRTGVAFDVLDVDHDDFATGVADLPDCETDGGPVVRTGSGRFHIYFLPSGLGRRIKFSAHCDWLGTDGYVVVPPSTHRAGGQYE